MLKYKIVKGISALTEIDSENENSIPLHSHGVLCRDTEENLHVTSQDIEYKHGGNKLSFMSLTVWVCCVRRVCNTNVSSTVGNEMNVNLRRRGRPRKVHFGFAETYSLRDINIFSD